VKIIINTIDITGIWLLSYKACPCHLLIAIKDPTPVAMCEIFAPGMYITYLTKTVKNFYPTIKHMFSI